MREEERSEVCWHALKDKHTKISTFPSPFLVGIDSQVEAPQSMSLPPRARGKAHFQLATSGYSRRRQKQKFLAFTFTRYCHSDCEKNFSADKVATELFPKNGKIAAKTIDFIFKRNFPFALDFKVKKFCRGGRKFYGYLISAELYSRDKNFERERRQFAVRGRELRTSCWDLIKKLFKVI